MGFDFKAHGMNKLINLNRGGTHLCRNVSSSVVHFHSNTFVKWYTLAGIDPKTLSGMGGTLSPEWVVHYGPE